MISSAPILFPSPQAPHFKQMDHATGSPFSGATTVSFIQDVFAPVNLDIPISEVPTETLTAAEDAVASRDDNAAVPTPEAITCPNTHIRSASGTSSSGDDQHPCDTHSQHVVAGFFFLLFHSFLPSPISHTFFRAHSRIIHQKKIGAALFGGDHRNPDHLRNPPTAADPLSVVAKDAANTQDILCGGCSSSVDAHSDIRAGNSFFRPHSVDGINGPSSASISTSKAQGQYDAEPSSAPIRATAYHRVLGADLLPRQPSVERSVQKLSAAQGRHSSVPVKGDPNHHGMTTGIELFFPVTNISSRRIPTFGVTVSTWRGTLLRRPSGFRYHEDHADGPTSAPIIPSLPHEDDGADSSFGGDHGCDEHALPRRTLPRCTLHHRNSFPNSAHHGVERVRPVCARTCRNHERCVPPCIPCSGTLPPTTNAPMCSVFCGPSGTLFRVQYSSGKQRPICSSTRYSFRGIGGFLSTSR